MHLLIDSDSLVYRAGFSRGCNEPGAEGLALWQLRGLVDTILSDTGCDSQQLYLTGSNNFRYKLYPNYKGNRITTARPIHLQLMRQMLVEEYGAVISDGNEADDAVAIAQSNMEDTAIAGIDKDLLTIPGKHYHFGVKTWRDISNLESLKMLYGQMIMGDKADNIPGFDGKMRQQVPKFLMWAFEELDLCENEVEMFDLVFDMYKEDVEAFSTSMHCLYLQKKEDDEWTNPLGMKGFTQEDVLERLTMAESGLPADSIPLSPQSFDQGPDDGDLSTSA